LAALQISPLKLSSITLHVEESAAFKFPNTITLYEYWNRRRGDRPRPRWLDINLMDIYAITPCLCVRDVIAGENDFICRYWGTRLVELYGLDCSGKRVAETYSQTGAQNTLDIYRNVLRSEQPIRLVGNLGYVGRSELNFFEGAFLRLDGEDQPDQHVIGVFQFYCALGDEDLAKLDSAVAR
tara:strand:- start:2331 stop:2876 length:546 start_codon:yes stop_codon:yes gene_type:complete